MQVLEKIKKYNQQQILRYKDELTDKEYDELLKQVDDTDFSYLDELGKEKQEQSINISPLEVLTIDKINTNKAIYKQAGTNALKNGEVGVLMLAGGMGTRLGSDLPKGMYNIGKTRDLYIFECVFNNLKNITEKLNIKIPFFIMTSELNDYPTRKFLKEKKYFGYDKNYIRFFVQDMAPCVDFNGKIFLAEKNKIATSPNGNGGWFNSLLKDKDAKQLLEESKIKYINFFGVDNVLVKMADPSFIGATILNDYECSAKVVKKQYSEEKVGVMCNKNGRPSVVEYMDFPPELANLKNEKGEAVYNYGTILNFMFKVDVLHRIKDNKLPLHIVTKKISYINDKGEHIKPEEPNGHKFEYLNVDLIQETNSCLVYEVEREKEFAPIKNKTGVDSVESAQELLIKNGIYL